MPPQKRAGQATGVRRIDGAILNVGTGAAFLGFTEKAARARIARQLLPFRRLGNGRIVFIKAELEAFVAKLEGVSVDEALSNLEGPGGSGSRALE